MKTHLLTPGRLPLTAVLVVTLVLFGTSVPAAIVNGSFELGTLVRDGNGAMSLNTGSTAITGWTTTTGELAWIDTPNTFGTAASDGARSLDLSGYHDSSPYGGIQQTVATTSGQSYLLEFDLGANIAFGASDSLTAMAGGASQTFSITTSGTGQLWQHKGLSFTATSASTLISFVGATAGNYIGLDNVSVSAVPEPATILLWAMGAIGISILNRQPFSLK